MATYYYPPGNTWKTLRISNYPCDWRLRRPSFYALHVVLAKWMHENEALAAALFIAASVALTALFAFMERRLRRK